MKSRQVWFVMLFACSLSAFAQLEDSSESAEAKCKQYLQTPLPAEASQVTAPKQWPTCDSYKLYSGIGTKADYIAARKCAWSERLAQQGGIEPSDTDTYSETIANMYGGSGMLAILYANGEGVEKNKSLALRFACESDFEGAMLPQIETDAKVHYCSDVAYTTIEMNFCAFWNSEIAAQKRQDSLDAIMQNWPQKDRDLFKLLQKASEDYVEAHGRGEVYQGGTIRGLRTNGIEEHQRDKFLEAVQSFESGHFPKGTQSDFAKADSNLNATYRKVLTLAAAQNFGEDDGLIRPEGIRNAEREWLTYRDAWIEFAKIHYATTDANSWLTLLTTNRFWSLRWTMCEVGWDDPSCKPK